MATVETNEGYLAARHLWTERHGDLAVRLKFLRNALAISIVANALMATLSLYATIRNPFRPFPVLMDQFGRTQGGGPASPLTIDETERVKQGIIQAFIEDMRTVTSDAVAQRLMVTRLYSRIAATSPAKKMLDEYFQAQSPFETARQSTITVRVVSILKQTDKTWEAEWTETQRIVMSGEIQARRRWRAVLTVTESQPATEAQAWVNPLGIYVTHISVAQAKDEGEKE